MNIMEKTAETADRADLTRDYDALEPVPMKARSYDRLSMFLMWFGANAKPGNWFIGGTFGVAGLLGALYITLLGSGLAYLFNAAIGLIGFTTGIATFALTRTIFGIRGSKIFSVLNATTFIGWCFINGIVAAQALDAILTVTLRFHNLYVCGAIMGIIQGVAVLWGREVIRKIGNIGSTILIVASVAMCVFLIIRLPMRELLRPMGAEAKKSVGSLLSMCIGVNLGWAPAAADFGRYAKDRATATWISYISLTITVCLFFMTGTMGYIATGSYDPTGQFLRMGLGWPFLFLIVILTVTTNVVNLYTGAMSLQNAFSEKLSTRKALLILAVIQVPLTTYYPLLGHAQTFFNYLSLVFGPIFTILLVDYFLIRKKNIVISELSRRGGIYWYTGGFNVGYILIDIIGIILYEWFTAVNLFATSVGGMIPMMLIVAALTYVYGRWQLKTGKLVVTV